MLRRVLTVLGAGFMAMLLANCGQTYKLQSITITPAVGYNLVSPGQTGAFVVTANYSNTKTNIVTVNSSYQIGASQAPGDAAPLNAVSVNNSGVVSASSSIPSCTWVATTSGTTTTYATYPYPVSVQYTENGITVQAQAPISMATAAGCNYGATEATSRPSSPGRAEAVESSRPE
jgi:hypothetical protein